MSQKTIERDAMYYATAAQKSAMKTLTKANGELIIHGYCTALGVLFLSNSRGNASWNVASDGGVTKN